MATENTNDIPNDEAELDAALEQSIADVKSGKTLSATTEESTEVTTGSETTGEAKPETKVETGATGTAGEGDGTSQPAENKGPEFRVPNKGATESDEAYEKRIELFNLVQRRKAAVTPEAKQKLSEEISKTKGDLKSLGESQKNYLPNGEQEKKETPIEDPIVAADRARLKALGGATTEDVKAVIQQERFEAQVQSDVTTFVDRHKDQLADPDMREAFFQFVDETYNWQGKSGKALMTTLELAYESMFKPPESITERVLKSADVQQKVNAMQFPGSTGTGNAIASLTPEQKQSLAEMKSTGMSEEKALELIS